MKTNLLTPESGSQERDLLTPSTNCLTPSAIPKYLRPETPGAKVLRSLERLAQKKEHLYSTRILTGGRRTSSQICRYVFEGDLSRRTPIRIGVFGGLRGDDRVGPEAIAAFLTDLVALPQLGDDLRISLILLFIPPASRLRLPRSEGASTLSITSDAKFYLQRVTRSNVRFLRSRSTG